MSSAAGRALDLVLSASSGERGRSGGDAPDRRAASGVPVLRLAPDVGGVKGRRVVGEPQARSKADAGDGAGGDLSKAQYQPAASGSQGVPLSVAGSGH